MDISDIRILSFLLFFTLFTNHVTKISAETVALNDSTVELLSQNYRGFGSITNAKATRNGGAVLITMIREPVLSDAVKTTQRVNNPYTFTQDKPFKIKPQPEQSPPPVLNSEFVKQKEKKQEREFVSDTKAFLEDLYDSLLRKVRKSKNGTRARRLMIRAPSIFIEEFDGKEICFYYHPRMLLWLDTFISSSDADGIQYYVDLIESLDHDIVFKATNTSCPGTLTWPPFVISFNGTTKSDEDELDEDESDLARLIDLQHELEESTSAVSSAEPTPTSKSILERLEDFLAENPLALEAKDDELDTAGLQDLFDTNNDSSNESNGIGMSLQSYFTFIITTIAAILFL